MSIQDALAAVRANPRNPDNWVALGDAFNGAGDKEKAQKGYQEALKLDPNHSSAKAAIARLAASPEVELPLWVNEPVRVTPASPAPVQTLVGIRCSAPGCGEAVIGQCSGYKKSCGKFYCTNHSLDVFCNECGTRLLEDTVREELIREYTRLAEKLYNLNGGCNFLLLWMFFQTCLGTSGIGVISGFNMFLLDDRSGNNDEGFRWLILSLPLFVVFLTMFARFLRRRSSELIALQAEAKAKQGFQQFYNEWVKHRYERDLSLALGTVFIVGGAAYGAVQAYQKWESRQEMEAMVRRMKGGI
jgi:tetratricopeptide (TPR) repeat protein